MQRLRCEQPRQVAMVDLLRLLLTQLRQPPPRHLRQRRVPPIIHSFRQMRRARLVLGPVVRARQLRAQAIIHLARPVAHVRPLALVVPVRQQDPVDPVDPEAVVLVVPAAPAEYDLALLHVRALMVHAPAVLLVQVALVVQAAHVPSRQAEAPGQVMPAAARLLVAAHPAVHPAVHPAEVLVVLVVPVVEVPVAAALQVLSVSKVASRAKHVRARRYVAKNSTTCWRQNSVESSSLVVMDLPRFEWHAELR